MPLVGDMNRLRFLPVVPLLMSESDGALCFRIAENENELFEVVSDGPIDRFQPVLGEGTCVVRVRLD